jgi:uncharacterized hydrophobic protein (TIGR00271 family)
MIMTRHRPLIALARQVLSLRDETDYESTIQQVREASELRSGGVWALAFAILIASVGLNVNSTAVIIGAMLISPLMGPIVGAGFALGTDDLPLLRLSTRNLLLSTGIALGASTLYFAISPLADAQSELLARTQPNLYDVLIALFGGGAGIVATSRKANKSTVIPGVAIATALMPPLCTAGFGLAHLDWQFFFGAMNLFLINALFICLATLTFVRVMRFERATAEDAPRTKRAHLLIVLMTFGLALPSAYTAWAVVQESRFRSAARRFVAEQLNFADQTTLHVDLTYRRDSSSIEATLIGEPMTSAAVDSLKQRLPSYGLSRTRLALRQPFSKQLSPGQIAELVREGLQQSNDARLERGPEPYSGAQDALIRTLQDEASRLRARELPTAAVTQELAALYPALNALGVSRLAPVVVDTSTSAQQILGVVLQWRRLPSAEERRRVQSWLVVRLQADSVELTNVLVR